MLDFSVIIPTFNRSSFLRQTLVSVLRQKRVSMEIIVIDDCSIDDTEKVVKMFKDERIKYIKNKKNLGAAINIPKCFHKATGKYIFALTDDDFILKEDTLNDILKIMKRHRVGMGKIGTISYEKSPQFPYKISILSDKLIILKPKTDKKIVLKSYDFGLGFFSGLTFDNSLIDKDKLTRHMGYPWLPMAFDVIKRHGIAYIPNHFIIAHFSTYSIPTFFNIKKLGSFYIEDVFKMAKEFISFKEFQEYKKKILHADVVMLPIYKYFTNNLNYIEILRKEVKLDKSLLMNPRFILYAISGFLPKFMIKLIRDLTVYMEQENIFKTLEKYNYFQEVNAHENYK